MKPVKILILYIKALKFRHDATKFNKQSKGIDFVEMTPDEFVKYLSKGKELKRRSYEIEEKLYNLKQKH